MTEQTQELVALEERFPALTEDGIAGGLEMLSELGKGLLPLIKSSITVPGAGGKFFEIETEEGEASVKDIECVIAFVVGKQRTWFRTDYEENPGQRPSCSSTDSETGYGHREMELDPGLEELIEAGEADDNEYNCADCPWSKWESDRRGGPGQDCQEFATMYLFTEGAVLPMVMKVPTGSLSGFHQYSMNQARFNKKLYAMFTTIGLEQVKNKKGTEYSRLTFKSGKKLTHEHAAPIKMWRDWALGQPNPNSRALLPAAAAVDGEGSEEIDEEAAAIRDEQNGIQ